MKKELKTKVVAAIGVLALILASTPLSIASDTKADAPADEKQKVEETKQDQTAEKRKEMMEEARSAIRETENALKALDEKKNKDALAALERTAGKLTIILAREPELALAPSDVNEVTYDTWLYFYQFTALLCFCRFWECITACTSGPQNTWDLAPGRLLSSTPWPTLRWGRLP